MSRAGLCRVSLPRRCKPGMTWTCPECDRVVKDEEAFRELLALDARVNEDADSLHACGACWWRYGPTTTPREADAP